MAILLPADIVVMVIIFLVVLALGIWSSIVSNRSTTAGYFLAGRKMNWWLVGLSLYVSNIGSATFVGVAGTASVSGYAVVSYEFTGLLCLLLLGFIFVPIYTAAGIYTVPEYLGKRFGGERLRIFLAITFMILVILASLSSEMYAGVVIIEQALGWNKYLAVTLLLLMTVLYTLAGGLTAVIYTDALQSVLILIGAFVLMILAFIEIGSPPELYVRYMAAIPNNTLYGDAPCGIPQEQDWHIFRPASDPDYPWPGTFFGITLLSCYYWCTNQVIVQRSLAAKNITHAKAASIVAAYLKLLPMVLMVYPGMISRALYPDVVACQTPETCKEACNNENGCSDIAYIKLMLELLPTGMKGFMVAALLAALMSSLTSIFNSLSSVFTLDLWIKVRPKCPEIELLVVGRIVTVVIAVISVLWLPVISVFGAGELFVYIQSITSYLSPPIFAVFSTAVAWERINEPGAFYGLMVGVLVGLSRLVLDFIYTKPGCGQLDDRPAIMRKFHYLHFALVLYAITVLSIAGISLMTPPIPPEKLVRLTWWTRKSKTPRQPMENKAETEQQDFTEDKYKTIGQVKPTEIEQKDHDGVDEPVGFIRRSWNLICGISATDQVESTEEEKQAALATMTSLEEHKIWGTVITVNAVICLGVGVWAFAFFG